MPEPDTSKNLLGSLGTLHASKEDMENAAVVMVLTPDGYKWFVSRHFASKVTAADLELMLGNLRLTTKRIAAQEGNKV